MSRPFVIKLLALAGVAGLLLIQFSFKEHRPDFSDFKVYWLAGAKALHHHTVYDVAGHYQYKYSPFVALLWSVPHLLGGSRYHWALAHYAACAAGFVALWFACARWLDRRRAVWLWLCALVTFGIGLRDELKLGQANLWPMLLVLPAWCPSHPAAATSADAAQSHGRHPSMARLDWGGLWAGAAWGFAIQWKLYALLLAPLWLLRRRASVFVGASMFTLASLWGALSLAHGSSFALAENVRWIRSLTESSQELLVSQYNVSALGVFGKWGEHAGIELGPWAYALWLLLALGWGVVLLRAELHAQRRHSPYLAFWSASWAWAGIVLLNPLVWPYWLNFCLPLYLAYVYEFAITRERRIDPAALSVIGAFVLANWLQNTAIVHEGASFVATCLLMFDAQRRARGRDAQRTPQLGELGRTLPTPRSTRAGAP